VVGVEQWAEVRRLFFVRGLSQRAIHRRTALHRDTIRNAINSETPPRYERAPAGSKLDPFKEEIHRLLKADPELPGQRVRELIAPLGYAGGKTIVDDYLRQVRPLFAPPRTFQRTIYRPGEICQFDLWEPGEEIPVGHGQTRKGWVVLGCLGYSRAGAGALVFSDLRGVISALSDRAAPRAGGCRRSGRAEVHQRVRRGLARPVGARRRRVAPGYLQEVAQLRRSEHPDHAPALRPHGRGSRRQSRSRVGRGAAARHADTRRVPPDAGRVATHSRGPRAHVARGTAAAHARSWSRPLEAGRPHFLVQHRLSSHETPLVDTDGRMREEP
jgi:hypothetical protein